MGLFDGLKSKESPTFDPQKSIMTIVFAAVAVDGNVSDEEVGYVRSMCARSPIFAKNTKAEDDALIDFADNVIQQLGNDALSVAAEALSPELKQTAFAYAAEIVLADGMVGESEEAFITHLSDILDVDGDLAKTIINVTLIRQRGA